MYPRRFVTAVVSFHCNFVLMCPLSSAAYYHFSAVALLVVMIIIGILSVLTVVNISHRLMFSIHHILETRFKYNISPIYRHQESLCFS